MKTVGYLLNTREGLDGAPGLYYDYILARNGVFVRARGPLMAATVLIGEAHVRGLLPLEKTVELPQGKMPRYFYDLALSTLAEDRSNEQYLAVTWDGQYHLNYPSQEGSGGGVTYERLPSTVLDIHSHGTMSAYFSYTDNMDEQGLGLYMVVGKLDMLWPEVELRVGVYGYFAPLQLKEVFGV